MFGGTPASEEGNSMSYNITGPRVGTVRHGYSQIGAGRVGDCHQASHILTLLSKTKPEVAPVQDPVHSPAIQLSAYLQREGGVMPATAAP